MKKIFLIRHAKSSWDDSTLSDHERPLTERGINDISIMGNLLKSKNIYPDLIISSTAERAHQTAIKFSEILDYDSKIKYDSRIYEATTQNLLEVTSEIDDNFISVFLFGHNPGLVNFANFLSNQSILNMPTCSIVGFDLMIESWKKLERHSGKLILFEFPKKYRK